VFAYRKAVVIIPDTDDFRRCRREWQRTQSRSHSSREMSAWRRITCQQVTSDVAIMRIWHKKFPRTSHEVLMAATGIWTTVTSLFERPNQVTAFDRAKRGH